MLTLQRLAADEKTVLYTVNVYDDLHEIPVGRFTAYNKQLLARLHLGSDLLDVHSHLRRLGVFIGSKNVDAIAGEYNNLVLTINTLDSSERPDLLALSALVATVNGTPCPDYTPAGLLKTAALLEQAGLTQGQLREALAELGKKLLPA